MIVDLTGHVSFHYSMGLDIFPPFSSFFVGPTITPGAGRIPGNNLIKNIETALYECATIKILHEGMKGRVRVDQSLVIWAIIGFVEYRVETGVKSEELENVVGFSLPHLRAVFSRCTGQPLARYVMSRRIARAAFDAVHTDDTFMEIAQRYGFSNPDTFTRAFKRVLGLTPQAFRKIRPSVGYVKLCAGVYGVSVNPQSNGLYHNLMERMNCVNTNEQKHISDGSVILYGVPKVHYGAFGGCTPYPICLKAVANYMGIDLAYEDALVSCGAAFRLVWDTTAWNGGNVDVLLAFDDPTMVFKSGIEALGHAFKILGRDGSAKTAEPEKYPTANGASTKDAFISFIKKQIDTGIPVIALGIIGPPEACVITGYRDNGHTLLGWNCFQDSPEFASTVTFDPSGYFVTSSWWDNRCTVAVMSVGEKTGEPEPARIIVERGILALEGRLHGKYAKGIVAYDAWKKALLDDSQFSWDLVAPLKAVRLMCQGDGMDCLADGRNSANKFFRTLAEQHPEQPLYDRLAEQFAACAANAHKMYETLGGWERGEAQMNTLMKRDTRLRLAELIDACKAADERALALMKEFARS